MGNVSQDIGARYRIGADGSIENNANLFIDGREYEADPRSGYLTPVSNGNYTVTSGFGYRDFRGHENHHGLDLGAYAGTPVVTACGGVVTRASWNGGYGNCVDVLMPDGIKLRYAHLSAIHVTEGQTIEAGTLVGDVGSTGDSTGPHLHFEVRKGATKETDGTPVNPVDYIDTSHQR